MVDFVALEDMSDAIERTISETENILGTLRNNIAQLAEMWTGSASEGFQRAQTNWMQGQQDLQRQLTELRELVVTAHDNHIKALATNVAMWQV
ncbi:MAG TPA: WXG100 family type VII secretion target [Pseudonocardiaceae bacterium]|jgi:WXG100 family type VII secretion target|nr:WXG100 family type VII secretion target [Pseudonocardiaceae bacterium]